MRNQHHHPHHNHEHNSTHNQRGHHNWRKNRVTTQLETAKKYDINDAQFSLLDLSAKVVAKHIPFQAIEQRYEHIPEPVQRRVIFWSFPRHEEDIKLYSSLSSDPIATGTSTTSQKPTNNHSQPLANLSTAWIDNPQANVTNSSFNSNGKSNVQRQITFDKGLRLYNERCVHNVLQVGFNLSGKVDVRINQTTPSQNSQRTRGNSNLHNNQITTQNIEPQVAPLNQIGLSPNDAVAPSLENFTVKSYRVSVTFDRCKITSVSCSCNLQDIFWCEHVVALILLRIRNPNDVDLRVPISETLLSLDRQQLQKLVQYIIAEHHTEVLPTAQRLLDQMGQSLSDINQIHGAPDPTAGACADDENIWHLDENQVNEKVYNYLNSVFCGNSSSKDANKQIHALFEKVREMFRAKDSNGTRLLKLMTEQFLKHAIRNDKSRPLWDQLIFLWVVVMLNPDLSKSSKNTFTQDITSWSKAIKCPREDLERRVCYKRKFTPMPEGDPHCDEFLLSLGPSPAHEANDRRESQSRPDNLPPRSVNQNPPSNSTYQYQLQHQPKRMRSASGNSGGPSGSLNRARAPLPANSYPRNGIQASSENVFVSQEPRSIFHIALDFQGATWDDPHLQLILNRDGPINYGSNTERSDLLDSFHNPLWSESISQSAARVETLRSYGYKEQALRLTVATVRRLKLHQEQWCRNANSGSNFVNHFMDVYDEGWIGHPFDPINVMVDMLLQASLTEPRNNTGNSTNNNLWKFDFPPCSCTYTYNAQAIMDITNQLTSLSYQHRIGSFPAPPLVNLPTRRASNPSNQTTVDKTTYFHVPVPGCCQKDSYLTLAVELALIALGQQRPIPTIATAHERAVRQESDLISKLESIDTNNDALLIDILKHQTSILLEGGPFQNSFLGASVEMAPLHTFAKYLFNSLVQQHSSLAYKIGVYALKMSFRADEISDNFAQPRASAYTHLRAEQLALAQTMFSQAKEEKQCESFLRKVYRASVKNINNPNNLLKLSKHVLKEANSSVTAVQQTIYRALLQTAFDLGIQVLIMTQAPHSSNSKARREAIQFIVDCATDMGLDSVLQVMKDASDYLSAMEALNLVVNRDGDCINLRCRAISKLKLKENSIEEIRLTRRSQELALECAARDPANCALEAIKFCEVDGDFLDRGLKTVIDAGASGAMNSSNLIEVANYVHNLGMKAKAFEIAIVAVDIVSIPVNSDNSSSRESITKACEYASEVNGFGILIPRLIKNINCATLLSEIYQKFNPFTKGNCYDKLPAYRNNLNCSYDYIEMMKQMSASKCWSDLLEHTMKTFVDITRSRLQNISPRHYGEFIDFLVKAQATFDQAQDGPQQFKNLIAEIIKAYRTKKKLMERLKERFDISYITGKV